MTGRGFGRDRTVKLPDVQSLNLEPSSGGSVGRGRGLGRGNGFKNPSLTTASIARSALLEPSSSDSTGKKYGNYDPSRPTYRAPERFRDRFKTMTNFEKTPGTEGRSVTLLTNYFAMQQVAPPHFYQLSYITVNFEPFVQTTKERIAVIQSTECLRRTDVKYFYDGRAGIYMAATKREAVFSRGSRSIEEPFRHLPKSSGRIRLTFERDIGHPAAGTDDDLNRMHGVLNAAFAKMLVDPNNNPPLVQIDDGFFDQRSKKEIQGLQGMDKYKLSVWPGYLPLLQQYDGGLLLNLELRGRFFRDGTALDALRTVRTNGTFGSSLFCADAVEMFKGLILLTQYNKMAYRIVDLKPLDEMRTFHRNRVVFNQETAKYETESKEMTIAEYLTKMYNVRITVGNQPYFMCLPCNRGEEERPKKDVNGKKLKPTLIPLVPELCWLSGLTDDIKGNARNMAKILDAARKEPSDRAKMLMQFAVNLNENTAARQIMDNWGLKLGVTLEEVTARELSTVDLTQAGKKVTYERQDADWTRNLRGNRLDDPKQAKNFVMVYESSQRDDAGNLFNLLREVSRPMGMQFNDPIHVQVTAKGPKAFADALKEEPLGQADIVLCLLPSDDKERYDEVKTLTTTLNGLAVPSQCILLKNVTSKIAKSIVTKVAWQMNAKMGGALWHIKEPAVHGDDTMVIGIVEGKASGILGRKVVAFVATVTSQYSSFTSALESVDYQISSNNYQSALDGLVSDYKEANGGRGPSKVIVYRVLENEGDVFDVVKEKNEEEKSELFKTTTVLGRVAPNARLLFCVVLKKCTSRFFAEPGLVNPKAGTIIDNKVTIPGRSDFYLISHNGRKGTVMPTYYFTISNTTDIQPAAFQTFTYQMTHMYFNWSGTIKYPAVCQYAQKMATMCGESTKDKPDPVLRRKLWFL